MQYHQYSKFLALLQDVQSTAHFRLVTAIIISNYHSTMPEQRRAVAERQQVAITMNSQHAQRWQHLQEVIGRVSPLSLMMDQPVP